MCKIKRWISLGLLCLLPWMGEAQELNARITVNGDKIAAANKQIFTTLQNALTEFVNNRKWTDATFAVNEKIDCTMTIIVNELDETSFKSEIQVQARRPVYNSSYTTILLNFRDQELAFDYTEGECLYPTGTADRDVGAIRDVVDRMEGVRQQQESACGGDCLTRQCLRSLSADVVHLSPEGTR